MGSTLNESVFRSLRRSGVLELRLALSIPRSHMSTVALDTSISLTYAAASEREWSEACVSTAGGIDPTKAFATLIDALAVTQAVLSKLADYAKSVASEAGIDLSSLSTVLKNEVVKCIESPQSCGNTFARLIAEAVTESISAGVPKLSPTVFEYLGQTPPIGGGGFVLKVG